MEDNKHTNFSGKNKNHILFRYFIFVIAAIILGAMIAIYSFKTSVIDADKWTSRMPVKHECPERGKIFDNDLRILAKDSTLYTLRIDYRSERFNKDYFLKNVNSLSDSLAFYFPTKDSSEWSLHLTEPLSRNFPPRAHRVLTNLTKEQCHIFNNWEFNGRMGLYFEPKVKRYNISNNATVGRVSNDNGQMHGYSGIEGYFDYQLSGQIDPKHAIDGKDIYTTINWSLQEKVHSVLYDMLKLSEAEWGSAVVMDVKTGDILAINNLTIDSVSKDYTEIYNHAARNYEFGSLFKTIPMTIALEDKLVTDTAEIFEIGKSYAYAGGSPINDAQYNSTLKVNDFLSISTNIGLVKLMERGYHNNPSQWVTRLEKTGFLKPLNTGIAGQHTPNIPSVTDDDKGRIEWSRQMLGYNVEVSPLALLAWYNAIANDGIYVRPRLVTNIKGNNSDSIISVSNISERLCSSENAAILRDILAKTVTGDKGTGRILRDNDIKVAGKTGTSYMYDKSKSGYDVNKKLLSFAGFFPADAPRYSCIVVINNPTTNPNVAASASGTVFKQIVQYLQNK